MVAFGDHRQPSVAIGTDWYHTLQSLGGHLYRSVLMNICTDRYQWPPMSVADGRCPNARNSFKVDSVFCDLIVNNETHMILMIIDNGMILILEGISRH